MNPNKTELLGKEKKSLVQVEEKETSEMIVDYRYISISSKSI
jgi:hypothetical protein